MKTDKELKEFKEFCDENDVDPMYALIWACKVLDWVICVEQEDANDDAIVNGLVIGTREYIDNIFPDNKVVNEGDSVN